LDAGDYGMSPCRLLRAGEVNAAISRVTAFSIQFTSAWVCLKIIHKFIDQAQEQAVG